MQDKQRDITRKTTQKMNRDAIYREYYKAKASKEPVRSVAKRFGVSRTTVYAIVRKMEKLDTSVASQNHRERLWKLKYGPMYQNIPKERTQANVERTAAMCRDMREDGFQVTDIARRIGKSRVSVQRYMR